MTPYDAKILIVENEKLQSMFLEMQLKKLHYNVVGIAETGEEAIEMVKQLEPDILLMDIMLDGEIDGIEAAMKILETSDISLIYTTGNSDRHYRRSAEQTDYVDFLIKPINNKVLEKALAKCLA